jgi:uncharacterized protein YacL
MNEIKRIVSIFFFPKNTFLEIKENPCWIIPFSIYIVILAITIIFTFLIFRIEEKDYKRFLNFLNAQGIKLKTLKNSDQSQNHSDYSQKN